MCLNLRPLSRGSGEQINRGQVNVSVDGISAAVAIHAKGTRGKNFFFVVTS